MNESLDALTVDTFPCQTCGAPAISLRTRLCDGCRDVETGLAAYLRRGGHTARAYVQQCLDEAAVDALVRGET